MAKILDNDNINLNVLFFKIKKNWYLFALFVPLFAAAGYFYAQSLQKVYGYRSVLLMSPKRTGSLPVDELLGVLEGGRPRVVNTDDEIGIITSHDMIRKAVNRLDFGVSLYSNKGEMENEIYPNRIMDIRIDSSKSQMVGVPIYITILSKDTYSLSIDAKEVELYNFKEESSLPPLIENVNFKKRAKFGKAFSHEYLNITILADERFESQIGESFHFRLNTPTGIVKSYKKKLVAEPTARDSYLIEMVTEGTNSNKEIAFLDTLMHVVIDDDLVEKNREGEKTLKFINQQIQEAGEALARSEASKEMFQSNERLIDYETQSSSSISILNNLLERRTDYELKLESYQSILSLMQNKELRVAPSSFNLDDNTLNSLFKTLSELNQEKASKEISETPNSSTLIRINRQIEETKKSIVAYLQQNIKATRSTLSSLNERIQSNQNYQTRLPTDNRRLEELNREFLRNKQRYEALLAKRDDARISLETNTADIRIIEQAKKQKDAPIAPNKKFIFIISVFMGLLIPFLVILFRDLFHQKIIDRDELKENAPFPLIGMIAEGTKKTTLESIEHPQSLCSECFRSLKFAVDDRLKKKSSAVIGLTSSIENEGKSFTAINLGIQYAQANVKTLLIIADLHKPTVHEYFPRLEPQGLSDYLSGEGQLNDIIQSSIHENLDIITAGSLESVRPGELFASHRMKEMINILQNSYQRILIDVPPAGLISDYFSLKHHMDITLFMIRYNYTPLRMIEDLRELKENDRLKNTYLVFNRVKYGQMFGFEYKKRSYDYYQKKS